VIIPKRMADGERRIFENRRPNSGMKVHPNKSYRWLKRNYLNLEGVFGFATRLRTSTSQSQVLRLYFHRPDSTATPYQGQRKGQSL